MHLELHYRGPAAALHPVPLLFVHGAWHDLWCWDDYFMPYFADHGYHTYALSLRGHGKSGASGPMFLNSVADYVADMIQVADQITAQHGTRPVVIGHSLGGLITQKYLETHDAPAAVLLASLPVTGVARFQIRLWTTVPLKMLRAALTLSLRELLATPLDARMWLFSEAVPEEQVRQWHQRLNDESVRVAVLDALFSDLPRPERVRAPVLVLGAANDRIFSVREQEATARAYQTQAVIFPRMAHNMMQEPGWYGVADHIRGWLAARLTAA